MKNSAATFFLTLLQGKLKLTNKGKRGIIFLKKVMLHLRFFKGRDH